MMTPNNRRRLVNLAAFKLSACLLAVALLPDAAAAQQPAADRPYTGIDAAFDAYRAGEAQRQEAIARQLGAIETVRWWRGLPPRWQPGIYASPVWLGFWQYDEGVLQPIGQRQTQTGRNTWESRPVYGFTAPPMSASPSRVQPPSPLAGPREF
jgi:hypothetical protein